MISEKNNSNFFEKYFDADLMYMLRLLYTTPLKPQDFTSGQKLENNKHRELSFL